MSFDWKAEVRGVVLSYTVGFMAIDRSGNGPGSRVAGSGTLVEFNGIRGIATAAHVAEAITGFTEVGLQCFRPGRSMDALTCAGSDLEVTYVRSDEYGPEGSDLAFVRLPPTIEAQIAASHAFFNSAVRWSVSGGAPNQPEVIFVTGLIAEVSQDQGITAGAARVEHAAIMAVGRLDKFVANGDGVDRMDFIRMKDDNPPPNSYGGLSGGGVWRLREGPLGKTLIGVAYYQLHAEEDGHRVIRCHGPLALHEVLYLAVLDRYAPDKAALHRAS